MQRHIDEFNRSWEAAQNSKNGGKDKYPETFASEEEWQDVFINYLADKS